LVISTAFGPAEDLPFDLAHLRHQVTFDAPPGIADGARRAAHAALGRLDSSVRENRPWAGVWRRRLSLGAAASTRRVALRDAFHLGKWRSRSRSPPRRLLYLWQAIEPLRAGGRGGGAGDPLAGWLADGVLAERLKWPFALPLLAAPLFASAGRRARTDIGGDAETARILFAYARGAANACDLSAELGRRATRLAEAAPKLRAKGGRPRYRRCLTRIRTPPGPAANLAVFDTHAVEDFAGLTNWATARRQHNVFFCADRKTGDRGASTTSNLTLGAPCASLGSTCVVAWPGAGKTEFLAQRAAYLLETGLCPMPFRVLAISFKTDAADNLAARVRKRCPPELANRFTSLTFDADADRQLIVPVP
jgi:hypothetical protein